MKQLSVSYPLLKKRWTPEHWVSLVPFGLGHQRPNNYAEIFRAVWENGNALGYAWRILSQGVCDGCALGTSGLRDWTLPGVHLCNIRLRLMRLNTLPALEVQTLEAIEKLRDMSSAELRGLGRVPVPLLRRHGERGFTRISWNEALEIIAEALRQAPPERVALYLTSRGLPNETYYVAQKAMRALGTNSVDNAARVCHSPSTVVLKRSLGVGASTCSYRDWLETDLLVFLGSNVANNQPVCTKYIHYARKNGAKVVSVNTYKEPGMERYWIPSILESALFGTRITDRFFLINTGGDIAFLTGALRWLIENDGINHEFVEQCTEGFGQCRDAVLKTPWETLERSSGVPRSEMAAFAEMLAQAQRAVLVWSMGITQHCHGEANVQAIVNLALSRGFVGRPGSGLMPIRGHSGVQGGAEMGAYATVFPGGVPIHPQTARILESAWGFPVPTMPGLTAPEMIDACARGEMAVLFSIGGNFLEVLPDPEYVQKALQKVPLRVHLDIVLSKQMLEESAEATLILPATTRYEIPGGVTETTTERRIIFSPEISGPRIPEARPEWQVLQDLVHRVKPEYQEHFCFLNTQEIREEIARIIPLYDGIQHLRNAGDALQYGGRILCEGGVFPTDTGRARFAAVEIQPPTAQAAMTHPRFRLATRRGKQFNSMVHEQNDPLTGAPRDAVFMHPDDAAGLRLRPGDRVRLTSAHGTWEGQVFLAEIKPGNVQVHWPESNVLLDPQRRSQYSGIPDYNVEVEVHRL